MDVKCHGDFRWLYGPSKQSMEFDVEDDQVQCHDGSHNETNECFVVVIDLLVFPQACGGALNLPLKKLQSYNLQLWNCMNIEIEN